MVRKPLIVIAFVLSLAGLACGLVSRSVRESEPEEDPAEGVSSEAISGEQVFQSSGCSGCHDGVVGIAPSLVGLFGEEVKLEDGETAIADEAYLRESILEPKAKIVQGYQPVMPDYQDQLSEAQVEALIQYIVSMGN